MKNKEVKKFENPTLSLWSRINSQKKLVFWFIEGTDNRGPALQLAVKNFDFCTKLHLLSRNWLHSK